MDKELKHLAKKFALQNAVKFNSTANPSNVLGKILGEKPEYKKEIALVQQIIAAVVREVNALSPEEQKAQASLYAVEPVKKEEKHELKELPRHPSGEISTFRFAPSPSGPLHIGHAYVISLNYLYSRKYKGTFILRIEDTNPENIYPDAYELIEKDAQWLTQNHVKQVIVQSERMEIYYKYALKLLEEGHAYVCLCDAEEFRKLSQNMEQCPCRDNSTEENVKRWEKMLSTYKQGEAVVRFKTDIKHKNPAMRDFPILRINEAPHPRQGEKYKIWPLMNFAVAIDDMELGVTHALRGKDHADNAKRQEFIHKALGVDTPIPISVGRINFTGTAVEVSCSKTRAMIENGEFEGWEDIRLPFVGALRRRGYQPEAFQKYATEIGISMTDKSVELNEFFKTINSFNKEVIDPLAHRYFFIREPIEVTIKNALHKHICLDLHPDAKKGGRVFETTDTFYLAKEDVDGFYADELYRLMDCLNFMKKGKEYIFMSEDYETYKKNGKKIIHWLPKNKKLIDVEILMPDNTTAKGYGEEAIAELEIGAIVQFERFGFCRLDSIEGNVYTFWFGHT